MSKRETPLTKNRGKYTAAIVLMFIGYALLAIFIGVSVYCSNNPEVVAIKNTNPYIASLVSLGFFTEVCFVISFVQNKAYRDKNKDAGIDVGKLCTFVYVVTIIGMLPVFIGGGVILIVYFIGKKFSENTTPISKPAKADKYTIRNENGYTEDIEYDKYSKDFRDRWGNHYETNDGGKTFTKK